VKAFLDGLYAGTKLADRDVRLGMLEKSTADLVASGDSFIAAGRRARAAGRGEPRERKNRAGALRADQARLHGSPDRKGRRPRGPGRQQHAARDLRPGEGRGHARRLFYKPQTTLQGIVEKHTGSGDFDAPQKQLDAIKALRAGRTTVFADRA